MVYITPYHTPLVIINNLGGGHTDRQRHKHRQTDRQTHTHTHTHTHKHAHAQTHTHIATDAQTKVISRNQACIPGFKITLL